VASPARSVVDVTEAGDAFASGIVYAHCKKVNGRRAIYYGMACALHALQTQETVPSCVNRGLVEETVLQYFGSK
jgi:sugar/nucleoside kinase (ribokinase family)